MGNAISGAEKPKRVLMVGLDAAGKTTMLYTMQMGDVVTTIPTIGFNVETVSNAKLHFTVWDVGGRDKIRPLWRHFYQGCEGVIFVVDSNDRDRIDDCRQELGKMCAEDELRSLPLLVFANKQDLPNAMTVVEVSEALGLREGMGRLYHVQPSIAPGSEGLEEGLAWLTEAIDSGLVGPPLVVMVTVVEESGTQRVSFTNLAGTELANVSRTEAAQRTFGDVQREVAERAEVEPRSVQFVLPDGCVSNARSTALVLDVLRQPPSVEQSGCVVL